MATLSPQQAADRAGVSRKAIMDAIKADKVRAWKSNENGRWEVVPDSLQAWMEGRTIPRTVTSNGTSVRTVPANADEVAGLQAERDEARIEARLAAKDVESLTAQLNREREVVAREQDTVSDLRRRLDAAEDQVRALTSAGRKAGLLERLKGAFKGSQ